MVNPGKVKDSAQGCAETGDVASCHNCVEGNDCFVFHPKDM